MSAEKEGARPPKQPDAKPIRASGSVETTCAVHAAARRDMRAWLARTLYAMAVPLIDEARRHEE